MLSATSVSAGTTRSTESLTTTPRTGIVTDVCPPNVTCRNVEATTAPFVSLSAVQREGGARPPLPGALPLQLRVRIQPKRVLSRAPPISAYCFLIFDNRSLGNRLA